MTQAIVSRSIPVSGVCCPCLTAPKQLLTWLMYLLGAAHAAPTQLIQLTHTQHVLQLKRWDHPSCWSLSKSMCWLSGNENIGILSSRFDWRKSKGKPQEILSICLSAEWGGASSEDRHLHNRVHLAGGFADHLHFAGPDPHTTLQLAQYPQKPGGCPVLF